MPNETLEGSMGFECHDCGETFAPGESTAPCTEQGHYVGQIVACQLPFLTPAQDS